MAIETKPDTGTWAVKTGLAQMLKGGVIMDVVTPEQAKIAEEAGAVAVMALERVPSDIRKAGGVARMSDPQMISEIIDSVTIPVMAKARIGHFVEAQVLEALGVDYIDESEVLQDGKPIDSSAIKTPAFDNEAGRLLKSNEQLRQELNESFNERFKSNEDEPEFKTLEKKDSEE